MTLVDHQFDLLKKELDLIDTAIRQIDDITKGVKNWAIVTWTASLGVTLATDPIKPYIWLTAIIPLLFWVVDGSYRRVQRSFITRNREISEYVNSQSFKSAIQTGKSLDFALLRMRTKDSDWRNSMIGVLLFRTVGALYAGLMAISLISWWIIGRAPGC